MDLTTSIGTSVVPMDLTANDDITFNPSSSDFENSQQPLIPPLPNIFDNEQENENGPSSSAARIKALYHTETLIVKLLETAGHAMRVLSGTEEAESDEEEDGQGDSGRNGSHDVPVKSAAEKQALFKAHAEKYMNLLAVIKKSLHEQTHHLTRSGIIAAGVAGSGSGNSIPFHDSVHGEQKELEAWLKALRLVQKGVAGLRKVAVGKDGESGIETKNDEDMNMDDEMI